MINPYPVKISVKDLCLSYGDHLVLDRVSLQIEQNRITAILGPSGQGKSSFLLVLNRLWETVERATVTGQVAMDFGQGLEDIHRMALPGLRQRVGMVFQMPNPLPMSVFKNIAFPLKLAGEKNRPRIEAKVHQALENTCLWDEVKDRLHSDARLLSGGQQQRLCLARALVLEPQVLLLDEPTSSLDRAAAGVIEDLLADLKTRCTIIMVSHYADQVCRIADRQFFLREKQLCPVG